METLFQDLRYALRALYRNPAFAAIAVTTIALGIGATTAIWSVARGRAAPSASLPGARAPGHGVDGQRAPRSLAGLALDADGRRVSRARRRRSRTSRCSTSARRPSPGMATPSGRSGAHASANLWDVLGVAPALGRTYTARGGPSREPTTSWCCRTPSGSAASAAAPTCSARAP